jgi:hypothetical protein
MVSQQIFTEYAESLLQLYSCNPSVLGRAALLVNVGQSASLSRSIVTLASPYAAHVGIEYIGHRAEGLTMSLEILRVILTCITASRDAARDGTNIGTLNSVDSKFVESIENSSIFVSVMLCDHS